jgi:hypothetical protein
MRCFHQPCASQCDYIPFLPFGAQSMGIVILTASGIVLAASLVTQRRAFPTMLVVYAVSISLSMILMSGFALRLANAFRLRWVSGCSSFHTAVCGHAG